MNRKDLIFELDSQLLDNEEIKINKEIGKQIIENIKNYDKIINDRLVMLTKLKDKYKIINDTKCNELILADESEYHRHRYLIEREKLELLDDVIKLFYE